MFMKKINIAAVGTSKFQGQLQHLRKCAEAYLTFRREPKNEVANSIAIIAHGDGKHFKVGYVPAKTAFWLAQKMDAGEKVRVYAQKDGEGNAKPFVVGGGKATLGLRCAFVRQTIDAAEPAVETETEETEA